MYCYWKKKLVTMWEILLQHNINNYGNNIQYDNCIVHISKLPIMHLLANKICAVIKKEREPNKLHKQSGAVSSL